MPRNPFMTPENRKQQAADWRWWRKRSPAGARRAWCELRNWEKTRQLEMRTDVLAEIIGSK